MRTWVVHVIAMTVLTASAAGQTAAPAPTPVTTKPDSPKPAAPSVSVGGVAYLHFAQQLKDTAHGNNFDVARAYLTLQGKFASGVGGRVTADIYRVADGSLGYRLKYAFASWAPGKGQVTARFGMTGTPWVEWEEGLWGYRMQGTVAMDRNGYLSSSDLGLALEYAGKDDAVSVQGGLYNGETYSKTPGDQRKDVMARASVRLLATNEPGRFGGLRITGYAHYGTPTGGGDRHRAIGMISYRSKRATLGLQHGIAIDSVAGKAGTRGAVTSGYAVLRFPRSPIALLARVDRVDPDTRVDGDRKTRTIAGISYKVSPNLLVLADLDHLSYQSGAPTPALDAVRSTALFQIQLTF